MERSETEIMWSYARPLFCFFSLKAFHFSRRETRFRVDYEDEATGFRGSSLTATESLSDTRIKRLHPYRSRSKVARASFLNGSLHLQSSP